MIINEIFFIDARYENLTKVNNMDKSVYNL